MQKLLFVPILLAACGPGTDPSTPEPVSFCSSELAYTYDPAVALTTWPDDWWTVPDNSTRTGLRLSIDPDDPAVDAFPEAYDNLLVSLGALDGAGTTPELIFAVSRALPADLSTLEVVLLTQAADGAWVSHDVSLSTLDHGRTLQVRPWRPLPPASRGVLAVRSALSDGSDCIAPSETLQALLTDPTAPLYDRYQEGLGALGWSAGDVGIMTVFTTQSAGLQDAAVIADIDRRGIVLDGPMDCSTSAERGYRDCLGTVTVGDYRDPASGTVPAGEAATVMQTYALPVQLWLPDDGGAAAPYPVVMCGHGLSGSKSQCRVLAQLVAPQGFATIAVDAVEHGDHPARTQDGDGLEVIMALCGFTLSPPSLDALRLRDNFRQSAWDKLQVLRAVQAGWDVDGDGLDDLSTEQLAYLGVSLGGIMGPQLLAAAPELEAGILIVPGGGLMDLFIQSDSFGLIAVAMTPADWEDDDLSRVVPLLQGLVEAGDPLVFAAQLAERRRAGSPQPHTAVLMAYEDAVVPNISTTRLAQALEISTIGEPLIEIPGVGQAAGPVTGNLPDGATGGLLQLDQVQPSGSTDWEDASHTNVHTSVQTDVVVASFLSITDTLPVLADPYSAQ